MHIYILLILLSLTASAQDGIVILAERDASKYSNICKALPKIITDEFEITGIFNDDKSFAQTFKFPNGETHLLISGLISAGIVIFDEDYKIKYVADWTKIIKKSKIQIFAMDKVVYRIESKDSFPVLVAEFHVFTDRNNADEYIWQFSNGSSSLRYSYVGSIKK